MYRDHSVAVVIPAHNEETQIESTVMTVPDFVDHIIVVDDCSQDGTAQVLARLCKLEPRLVTIRHEVNGGVGAAISTGYVWARDHEVGVTVVMAGDGQMDPDDLPNLLDPVVEGRADYAKGNRLLTAQARKRIPAVRFFGNSILSFLTKIASGYWHVTDSQTGYTAVSRLALEMLPIEDIYPRYGMPNDFLVTLNIYGMRVVDVPVNPVYGVGERSGIKIRRVVFSLSWLMLRLFWRRMIEKYIIRDFHPLVLFYSFGFFLLLADIPLVVHFFYCWHRDGLAPQMSAIAILFCSSIGMQSIISAMLFDMEANRELRGVGPVLGSRGWYSRFGGQRLRLSEVNPKRRVLLTDASVRADERSAVK